jgi:long-chain acyl-CoA synthetase
MPLCCTEGTLGPVARVGGSYELLQHPDRAKYDTSSLKRIGAGGAPVAPRFPGELSKAFTGASPLQG